MWKCPPSTILVPVDFGDASARALEVAGGLARRFGARLRLLHAETIETPPYFTHEQLATIERERQAAREQANAFLRDFAVQHGIASPDAVVIEGPPTATIVEAARAADLVVMGTHGRRGPSRWWMGSVAERVIHESPSPVLVVRADLGGVGLDQVFAGPLVVAREGEAAEAIRVAKALAQADRDGGLDPIPVCEADVARDRRATLMVVSRSTGRGPALGHPAEYWLRSCTLPMLFVPAPSPEGV